MTRSAVYREGTCSDPMREWGKFAEFGTCSRMLAIARSAARRWPRDSEVQRMTRKLLVGAMMPGCLAVGGLLAGVVHVPAADKATAVATWNPEAAARYL